jgi:hypothetical protein
MKPVTVFLDEPSTEGFLESFVIGHPFLFGLFLGTGGAGLVLTIWEVTLIWWG